DVADLGVPGLEAVHLRAAREEGRPDGGTARCRFDGPRAPRRHRLTPGAARSAPMWVRRDAMDAITLLRDDHKTVERLFKRFEKAGDRALVEKRSVVDRIIEELSVHAAIEEQVF